MSLVDIHLINGGKTVIDSSNAGKASDTIQLNLVSNGTVTVDGVDIKVSNLVGLGAASNTTIEAINGANVTIAAGLANVGALSKYTYAIGANSSIAVNANFLNIGLLNNVTVDFANANGTGLFTYNPGGINLNLSSPPKVVNIQDGDRIEVGGSTAVSQSGNTINFTHPGLLGIPTTLGSYSIPAGVTYTYNAATSTLTFTSCFLRGTRIRTLEGEVPVEDLRVGDFVITHRGASEVKWIGRRMIDPKAIEKPRDTLPIRIQAGAIAENVPSRDLYVSPDHCMFLEQSLIPAKLLVNGATVSQEVRLHPFQYYHIELEQHSIVIAEGAETETYLDISGRQSFLEPGTLVFGTSAGSRTWNDCCYPPVYAGAVLEKARLSLQSRAEKLGYVVRSAKAS